MHELSLDRPTSVTPPLEVAVAPRAVENAEWVVRGARRWRYIVIHHSVTDGGNAETFDAAHRRRGWDELGYHFVITNGKGGRNGQVEIGSRWRSQKWGAHCGGTPNNEYNNFGIGICLVGDFTRTLPSRAQLASLRKLLLHLMRTYDIAPEDIIGHCDAPKARTECPGKAFHAYMRGRLRTELARRIAMGK